MNDCKKISLKTRVNFRLIFLFTIVFFIQYLPLSAKNIPDNNRTLLHYTEKKPSKPDASDLALNIEAEVTEEDDVDHTDRRSEYTQTIQYTIAGHLRTSSVHCSYLQLELNTHRQNDRPFFMLYCSWKTHLS